MRGVPAEGGSGIRPLKSLFNINLILSIGVLVGGWSEGEGFPPINKNTWYELEYTNHGIAYRENTVFIHTGEVTNTQARDAGCEGIATRQTGKAGQGQDKKARQTENAQEKKKRGRKKSAEGEVYGKDREQPGEARRRREPLGAVSLRARGA